MLKSIKHVLGLVYEALTNVLKDPMGHAINSAAWLIQLGAGLWLVLFAANFVLKMIGL
jgi:hypothetical protein